MTLPLKSATVVCSTCGMPIRVIFTEEGEVEEVFAVCGHGNTERERHLVDDAPDPDSAVKER